MKRVDFKFNCSFGTNLNCGAKFQSPPILPHGPYGIIIGHDSVIGKMCTIYHQVTVVHGGVVIGDNVILGAGSKILKNCKIGNDAKVGANCVVVSDIPDKATTVLSKPRIIRKE
ncbi:serine O-acetyltransferase [Vibrio halioticoli]